MWDVDWDIRVLDLNIWNVQGLLHWLIQLILQRGKSGKNHGYCILFAFILKSKSYSHWKPIHVILGFRGRPLSQIAAKKSAVSIQSCCILPKFNPHSWRKWIEFSSNGSVCTSHYRLNWIVHTRDKPVQRRCPVSQKKLKAISKGLIRSTFTLILP